jgi:lysophospholipase L1-like esterase
MSPARYVALGDSFSARPTGFADRLAELLRPRDYRNLALRGARTRDVVGGQLRIALRLRPDVVTIVCGGNDALLSVRPDTAAQAVAFERALATLRVGLPEATIATATIPDPSRFLPLRTRSAQRVRAAIDAINESTRARAQLHGVLLLDIAAHPETAARANYADDGYHPSPAAAARTAAAFAQLLGFEPAIQEAS